jgi:hypothetical protein
VKKGRTEDAGRGRKEGKKEGRGRKEGNVH